MRKLLALSLATMLLWASVVLSSALGWDDRLTDIGVVLEPALDCSGGCWRIVDAYYLDEQESGGLHHLFIKLLDEHGNQVGGLPWRVTYPDGNIRILSKPAPDWADFALYDCFNPETERGGYTAFASDDPARSDWISGMGLVSCHHVSFGLTWQWSPGFSLPIKAWLPIAIR